MINSHNEMVKEIEVFTEKMDLINSFKYLKDHENIIEEVNNADARVFVLGLESIDFDDENYNTIATYSFMLADETLYDTGSILNSEEENIFCVSSLGDYLNYLNDAPIEFSNVSMSTESINDNTYTSISGKFDFIIKRSPSYWKKMEEYNQ